MIVCKWCKRDLPESAFSPSRLKRPPHYCKECLLKDLRRRVPLKGRKFIGIEKQLHNNTAYFRVEGASQWLDPIMLSYCAGIIDGEGSILISKGKQAVGDGYSYEISVRLHMMDGAIPKLFYDCFGGKYSSRPALHANAKGKYVYQWAATGATARVVLDLTCQYLKIKMRIAEVAMYFHDRLLSNQKGKRITSELLEKREAVKLLADEIRHTPVNEVQIYE